MKIYLANNSKQSIGGGWTFLRTFEKYLKRKGVEVVASDKDADVIFISGATMVDRDFVSRNKKEGKKIVVRIDNIPRNSRNRNTGTSRLYDFVQMSDLVVYQSDWAEQYLRPFLHKHGPVIINGADTDIFNTTGPKQPREGNSQFLYVQYNRDETKQFHQAWYHYQMIFRKNKNAHLWIIGNFSPELCAANFDFFMGERFRYIGVLENPEDMAEYYRAADILLMPYYNDACSQTLVEMRNCAKVGSLVWNNGSGGTKQIMESPLEHLSADYMVDRYIEHIQSIL